jgi:hypothetical protein
LDTSFSAFVAYKLVFGIFIERAWFPLLDRGAWSAVRGLQGAEVTTPRALAAATALEAAVDRETARFEGREVDRPEHWSGWRVRPLVVEFWRDRPFRLHDRLRFTRSADGWDPQRLWP